VLQVLFPNLVTRILARSGSRARIAS
jgi:hypothetical protein